MIDRVPPQNIEAEQSTLGSMLLERDAALKGIEILNAEDFYRPVHQEVFDAIKQLTLLDRPVDIITLQDELRKRGKLEDVGGTEYIMALVETVPTAANVEHYAGIVQEKSERRRVISACSELIGTAYADEQCNAPEMLIEKALTFSVNRGVRVRSQQEVMSSLWSQMEEYSNGIMPPSTPFSIPCLQKIVPGIKAGWLLTIAAESGGGKSVLLNDLIEQAGKHRTPTLVFSYDMDAEDYALRTLCARTSQDSMSINRGRINWDVTGNEYAEMLEWPIDWEDLPCSLAQVVAVSGRWALKNVRSGNGLIVVDYIQRVSVDHPVVSKTAEVTEIVQGLKNMARRLNVQVATASQFVKKSQANNNPRSTQDLRDSKTIEDESDIVIIARPNGDPDIDNRQRMQLVVAKHRRGPLGTADVIFNRKYTRFEELLVEDLEEPACTGNTYQIQNWWED